MVRKSSDLSLLTGSGAEHVQGDVADGASLNLCVEGADVVFHVAGAIAAFDQDGFDRVNVEGTRNLIRACLSAVKRPSRFMLVSSIAAAGPSTPDRPLTEADEPAPVSMYGRSKLRAEQVVHEELTGLMPWTIIRPPIVYGPGDTATLDLFKSTAAGVAPRIMGDDRPMSFVYVRDLVEGMITASTSAAAADETFFLCGPQTGTMADFHNAIARALGVSPMTIPVPLFALSLAAELAHQYQRLRGKPRPFGRDKVSEARQAAWTHSIEHARACFGYDPKVDFAEGVPPTLAWYRRKEWM
jgi:nucleoside-diphosphate-sugar epimerase